jgi:hypothetical protein
MHSKSVGPTLTPASNTVNAGMPQIPDGDFEAFCLKKERKIAGSLRSSHSNRVLPQLVEKMRLTILQTKRFFARRRREHTTIYAGTLPQTRAIRGLLYG